MISRGRESEEPLPDLGNLSEADIAAVQSKGWNIEVHTIGGTIDG
jgi:hypothetical protein